MEGVQHPIDTPLAARDEYQNMHHVLQLDASLQHIADLASSLLQIQSLAIQHDNGLQSSNNDVLMAA